MDRRDFIVDGIASLAFFLSNCSPLRYLPENPTLGSDVLIQYNFKEEWTAGNLKLKPDSFGAITVLDSSGYYVTDYNVAKMEDGYRSLIFDPSTGIIFNTNNFSGKGDIVVGKLKVPKGYSYKDLSLSGRQPLDGEPITFKMYSDIWKIVEQMETICDRCFVFQDFKEPSFCFGNSEIRSDMGLVTNNGILPHRWKQNLDVISDLGFVRYNSGSPIFDNEGALLVSIYPGRK